jgi:hypothetical protein
VTEFELAVLDALIEIDRKVTRIEHRLEQTLKEVLPHGTTPVSIKVTPGTPQPITAKE